MRKDLQLLEIESLKRDIRILVSPFTKYSKHLSVLNKWRKYFEFIDALNGYKIEASSKLNKIESKTNELKSLKNLKNPR